MFILTDEIAFVTGAGSGIVQGIAIGLAEAGADVALFDLPSAKGLDDTAKAIVDKGRRAVKISGNVSDADALASAIMNPAEQFGGETERSERRARLAKKWEPAFREKGAKLKKSKEDREVPRWPIARSSIAPVSPMPSLPGKLFLFFPRVFGDSTDSPMAP